MSLLILTYSPASIMGSKCICIIAVACGITVGDLLAYKQQVLAINHQNTNFKIYSQSYVTNQGAIP